MLLSQKKYQKRKGVFKNRASVSKSFSDFLFKIYYAIFAGEILPPESTSMLS